MSTTIGDLIDRVYREYLEPVDNVESYSYLTGGIDNAVTTVGYANDMFSVEEEDALDAGAIVEVGTELMFSKALNTVTNEITVVRGVRGTDKAAHSAGDIIKIAPSFPRKNVFDAVSDQIKNLYPTLFAVETLTLTASAGYKLLGTHGTDQDTYNYIVTPIKAISQYTDFSTGTDTTSTHWSSVAVEKIELPNPFTYTDDAGVSRTKTYTKGPSTVNALQYFGIADGHTAYVTFKKKFIAPALETDTLASIGLETEYEPIVMTGVAAQLIAGKDVKLINSNYITEQLEAAAYPVGSSNSISSALLRYQQLLIQQARSNLRSKYPEAVVMHGVNYPS